MTIADPHQLIVRVTGRKRVPREDVERARDVVARALAHASRTVPYADVTLTVLPDPAVPEPCRVSIRVDLDGHPVHAHAAGASMPEAVGLAGARLRSRLRHASRHRNAHTITPAHPHGR